MNRMLEYVCVKCGSKSYSAASPEYLLHDGCIVENCDGKTILSEKGMEMCYGKEKAKQVLDEERKGSNAEAGTKACARERLR